MPQPVRISLMPGVWLTAIQTRKFKSSRWSLQLLTPLRRETASMTALLPRVLRQGTAREPDGQRLGAALERLCGGTAVPTVQRAGEIQAAGFQAAFPADALTPDGGSTLRRAAELLGDLLLRPATRNGRLRGDYLDRARASLLSALEYEGYEEARNPILRLRREMCAAEPAGISPLGDAKRAAAIRVGRLDRHYRAWLEESWLELYYCGAAEPDRAAQAWTEALMGLPRRGRAELPETQVDVHPKEVRTVQVPAARGDRLALGFRTMTGADSPDEPALLVLCKLFTRLEDGLCAQLDRHKGMLLVSADTEPGRMDERQAELLAQLERLRDGAFSAGALERARGAVTERLRGAQDSPEALMRYYTPLPPRISPEELEALVQETGRADVARAAERLELDTVCQFPGRGGEEV